jgi:hypothetical protein
MRTQVITEELQQLMTITIIRNIPAIASNKKSILKFDLKKCPFLSRPHNSVAVAVLYLR